jgi:thiol-disulfide isomerase/thioredoxin
MKKILLILTLIIAAGCTRAQETVDTKNIQNVPPFKILRQDSTWFSAKDLKKNKPVMIIYFAPDCSHCQHLMYDLKPHMKELKNVQIVMVTFTEASMLKLLQDFYKTFDLKKYPNVTIGTEGHSYVVQRYYQVRMTPYIAIYDRKGKIVKAYVHAPSVKELVAEATKG